MNELQQFTPKQFPKIWAIVIAVVLTALIAGGGVCLWQTAITKDIQQQISNLQDQMEESKKMTEPSSSEQKLKVTLPSLGRDEEGAENFEEIKEYGGEKELDQVMLDVIRMGCFGMGGATVQGLPDSDRKLYYELFSKYCGRFVY